jgi:hypothetical protein
MALERSAFLSHVLSAECRNLLSLKTYSPQNYLEVTGQESFISICLACVFIWCNFGTRYRKDRLLHQQEMRKFGLIGYPLGHSFSKKYFTAKFETEGDKGLSI